MLGGDENAKLEVISHISEETKERLGTYLEKTPIEIMPLESDHILDMIVTVFSGASYAKVRIADEHTQIVLIEKDGEVLQRKDPEPDKGEEDIPDYSLLTVHDIYDFACTCDLEDVREILDRQIECNTAIAEDGLKNDYGANIGKVLLKTGNDLKNRAKAYAAAGSDARMNGCELPVVICSGSGNQGLTVSLPVIVYAEALNADREKLYRALLLSNLITLHAKTGIGRLAVLLPRGREQAAGSRICSEGMSGISPIPSSIHWQSHRGSSAMAQNLLVPQRSRLPWRPAFSAMKCSNTGSSSMPATVWSKKA